MDSPYHLQCIQEDSVQDQDQEQEQEQSLTLLEKEIERLKTSADLLQHRLHTMQDALSQETFQLAPLPIQVLKSPYSKSVHQLLTEIGCQEEGLTVGTFLKALNIYLVRNDLVDLNDLQIIMTPLLSSAFQKAQGLPKYPYCLLLTALPKMFQ